MSGGRTWAALSSKFFSNLSNTWSQSLKACKKSHDVEVPAGEALPALIACNDVTNDRKNGSNNLTKTDLRAARRSST